MAISKESVVNGLIKSLEVDTNLVSDGYHTFGELYEHRITVYIQMCKLLCRTTTANPVWRSYTHSDGSVWNGWFILGVNKEPGKQISYHLPIDKWNECHFAITLEKAPEFDGHTSADVLERIKDL